MQIREILLSDQKSPEEGAQEPETFFDAEEDFQEATPQAQLPASSTNGLTITSLGVVAMPILTATMLCLPVEQHRPAAMLISPTRFPFQS